VHTHRQNGLSSMLAYYRCILWEFLHCKAMYHNIIYRHKYIKDFVEVGIKLCGLQTVISKSNIQGILLNTQDFSSTRLPAHIGCSLVPILDGLLAMLLLIWQTLATLSIICCLYEHNLVVANRTSRKLNWKQMNVSHLLKCSGNGFDTFCSLHVDIIAVTRNHELVNLIREGSLLNENNKKIYFYLLVSFINCH
jgi:hypothetical protein